MLQDFSSKSTLENLRELRRIEQEYEKVLEALHDTILLSFEKRNKKDSLEGEISRALVVKQEMNVFSRFASIFHMGKYYKANQQIAEKERKLSDIEEECRKLEEQEKKLQSSEETLKREKEIKRMPECMREENGKLVITDGKTGLENYDLKKNPYQMEANRKVLVHCTDFFPRDNIILSDYDGEKIGCAVIEYHGVRKETSALIHRHEVHCTINNRVENTGAGEGTWNNPSYMVIDRYDIHQDEMESTCPSDAWTKGTSIQLSDSAVIMVRLQDKDKLPIQKDEIDKYNIVYYDGDPTTCLRNFLRLNNYDIFYTDPNYPGHAYSTRILQEYGVEVRNLAINFVKDNTHFSKTPPVFSATDIALITDVGTIKAPNIISSKQGELCIGDKNISESKKQEYLNVVNFALGAGIKRTEDGRYTFLSDEEILKNIEKLRGDTNAIPSSIDVDLLYEIYEMQQQVAKRHSNTPLPSIEQISSMSLQELYKFGNQLACERVNTTLQNDTGMTCRKDYVTLEIYGDDCTEIGKRVKAADRIHYVSLGSFGYLEENLDKLTTVADVAKSFDYFRKKVEQIKAREIEASNEEYEER